MLNLICPDGGAITISTKDKNLYVDTDKCNRYGICRVMCMAWSQGRVLEQKSPWLSED